ncbi:MAG: hypothetical protein VYB44_01625 [Bacteroidota bacterium]|nr:hypothetical protein [Bacteroidota bacterium]
MRRLKFAILFFLLIHCLSGCNQYKSGSENQVLNLPQEFIIPSNKLGLIYYFDGDCSLCFHRIKSFKSILDSHYDFRDLYFKAIGTTNNVDLFTYNTNLFELANYVIIDLDNNFYEENKDTALLNNTYIINRNREILRQYDSHTDFDELVEEILGVLKAMH